jgi:NADH-quinone oxidoreductase subunit C
MSHLPDITANLFGPEHRVVEREEWHAYLAGLKADGFVFFDWLSAVDEQDDVIRLVAHVARLDPLEHVLVVTYLDRERPHVASLVDVYAGAAWHERETHEMFGVDFGAASAPLLLPDGFEGHPLRKDFVLASRQVKAWPGGKEPGESDADSTHSPSRRRVKPPGVPDGWLKESGEAGASGG